MTIYALSTPPGRGAIAIIRLSGGHTQKVVEKLTGKASPEPRLAALRVLSDPETGDPIDSGLVLFFQAPHSYTSEDMAELHIHGGVAIVDCILEVLSQFKELRPAEPGEFTRLAVLNGRMDLTQAEAVADMIDSETIAQQKQAFRQMQGALGELYEGWRQKLALSLAHLEADIEFADEDLPGGIGQAVLSEVAILKDEIAAHILDDRGRTLRHGVEIAIIGAPNVGKSSVLNYLAGREAAIVSARAGTTRDVVEVSLTLGGVPAVLADTAGIREAGDEIEREGVRRALKRATKADIRLHVTAFGEPAQADEVRFQEGDIYVANKQDLGTTPRPSSLLAEDFYEISAQTGAGMPTLIAALNARVQENFGLAERPALTRTRHRNALQEAGVALERSLERPGSGMELELVAEDLRLAMREIGRITGAVDVESLLDIVFRDFCIGK
jgi:tRNA modification GTPase